MLDASEVGYCEILRIVKVGLLEDIKVVVGLCHFEEEQLVAKEINQANTSWNWQVLTLHLS